MSLPTVTMRLDGRGIRRLHCGRVDGGSLGHLVWCYMNLMHSGLCTKVEIPHMTLHVCAAK
jgi:hypothetical protein